MPKFSVVIAVYNKEKNIASTLQSVLKQTFTDFEVIIINDGSVDNSEKIIKSFSDSRIKYFYQENKGAGAARNTAIKKACGVYIALLDADDYWYPFYLAEQNQLIKNYPNQSVFATAQEIIDGGYTYPKTYSLPEGFTQQGIVNYFESSHLSSILHSSSTVIKKNVFQKTGYYDPKIISGQDTDLYIRIGLSFHVVFSKKICSAYRLIKNSLFRSTSSLTEKIKLEKYKHQENENPQLKKFLDINRYSLAIFAKLNNDKDGFKKISREINKKNLNKKQKFLLFLPRKLVCLLNDFKYTLQKKIGVNLSAFK